MRELVRLADYKHAFDRLGLRVFALMAESEEDLGDLQTDLGGAITVLADPAATAIERFGMLDPDPFPPNRRLARSGIFFIDPKGVVRFRWLVANYREATDPEEILRALR